MTIGGVDIQFNGERREPMGTVILCPVCGGKSKIMRNGGIKCRRCGSFNTRINPNVLDETAKQEEGKDIPGKEASDAAKIH